MFHLQLHSTSTTALINNGCKDMARVWGCRLLLAQQQLRRESNASRHRAQTYPPPLRKHGRGSKSQVKTAVQRPPRA